MFVAASMTETELSSSFVTYILVPVGFTATSAGKDPTDMVAATVFVKASMTESELLSWFTTYIFVPAGFTATP